MENSTIINDSLNFLKGSTFSQIVGIIAFISSIYFYKKSKKNRHPTYIIRTINLIKEKIQKIETVEIRYSGEVVNNLSISKIAFWNDGKETINSTDIAQIRPIKVKINDEFQILDAKILFQKNEANDFKIQISNNHKFIDVTFDYIDFEDGFVIQVYHTGNSSDDIHIEGQIKSVKSIIRKDVSKSLSPFSISRLLNKKNMISKNRMKSIIGWTTLILGVFFICFYPTLYYFKIQISEPVDPNIFSFSLLFTFWLMGIIYIWMGYQFVRKNIPKGFNIFNEEM